MSTYIDVGNTNIKIMDEKMSIHVFPTKGFNPSIISSVLLGSDKVVAIGVVPDVLVGIQTLCKDLNKIFNCINTSSRFSFKHNVAGVGIDRLVAIEGGLTVFDPPFVVIDAGTAITADFVVKENSDYVFKGGVIIPGFELCFKTLNDYTSMLPRLKPITPTGSYGKDTMNAMNCGICLTLVGGLKDIIEKTQDELALTELKIIITGGAGKFLGDLLEKKYELVDNLIFRGMMNIYNGRGV